MNYSNEFFNTRQAGANHSANTIVPFLIETFRPKTVLDVGCGTGSWLNCFIDKGITDVKGIDGVWIDPDMLEIPKENFLSLNLNKKFNLNTKFDLVLSLEVAEHICPEFADGFVENLIRHGDIIFFAAAIPGQGGNGHVNEQWPMYWIKTFKKYGYDCLDFRGKFWDKPDVSPWYSQNSFIFFKDINKNLLQNLKILEEQYSLKKMDIVHPKLFYYYKNQISTEINYYNLSLKKTIKFLPKLIIKRLKNIR